MPKILPYCRALVLLSCFVAAPASSLEADHLESLIARGMADWQVPGLAIAVIEDGETVYAKGFGHTAVAGGQPVTVDTPFAIASTTKAMIVAGLLMQVDAGRLSLDVPVVTWLPELRFADPSLAPSLTLRDLLAHRTGMPSTDFLRFLQGMTIEEQLNHLPFIAPESAVRTRLIYQNTMYELAGLVLERVTGKFWGDVLRESLWDPIGMTSTFPRRGDIPGGQAFAQPHDVLAGALRPVSFMRPADEPNAAGSVWSTASDMARWAEFLLRGGVTEDGARLLSEAAVAAWFEPAQLAAPADFYPVTQLTQPKWRSYALGWFQQDHSGQRIDFHTGSLRGLVAILGLDRDAGKAIVVLANRDHAELRHTLLWDTLDPMPAAARRDWHADVWALYEAQRTSAEAHWQTLEEGRLASKPSLKSTAYSGEYRSNAWGSVEVTIDGDVWTLQTQHLQLPLTHWHGDTFLATHADWQRGVFVTFDVSPGGSIDGLEVMNYDFDKSAAL